MFKRALASTLGSAAGQLPVVTLLGPRQSGKTTLAKATFPQHKYVSLEQLDERDFATKDPRGFLAAHADRPVILDEVQRVPELLSYIQVEVDRDATPGRFILTGSQNLLLMQSVSQSLAGRTALLRLLPLSVSELSDVPALNPNELTTLSTTRAPEKRSLWELVWSGFYPRIHALDMDPRRWLADYHRTYVERDLRDVLKVMDLDAFDTFLRLAAARTGQELNLNELATDAGISQPTARQWLSALKTGFICTWLPPHFQSYRKRLRKRSRLHFLDTGLVCHLLNIQSPQQLMQHPLRGAIFETYVVGELHKAFENRGETPPLYFWRDATGREIDVLMDLGTHLVPIEIKSGATVPSDALDTLKWWSALAGNDNKTGVLIHGGERAYVTAGIAVRPWWLA
jgi:uncharacterized protein